MCGRYTLKTSARMLEKELDLDESPQLEARYNIAPTQAAPIVTDTAPRKLTIARWGLLPFWAKDPKLAAKMINARSETLLEKPAFKEALEKRRCLVPCDGFYEWRRHGRQHTPMFIELPSHGVLTMAGLWSSWRSPEGLDVLTFTICTTRANEFMAPLHDRMPVFLDREARARWLSGPTKDTEALLELLKPWHGAPMTAIEVSPRVNSVELDDPSCIEPAKTVQLSLL